MPWDAKTANLSVAPPREVLTDDVLEGLSTGKIVASDVAPTIPGINPANIERYVLDCVWAAVDGALPPEKVVTAMQAVGDIQVDVSSVLEGVFWIVWVDLAGDNVKDLATTDYDSNVHVGRLVDVIKKCMEVQLVSRRQLLSSLEVALLVQLGLLPPDQTTGASGVSFTKRCTTTQHRLTYKLDRYNIFREESEGYSKLLTLLNNKALARVKDESRLRKEITKLIGYFDLCPVKTLDCILGAIVEGSPDVVQLLLKVAPLGHPAACNSLLTLRIQDISSSPEQAEKYFSLVATLLEVGLASLPHVLSLLADELPALKQAFADGLNADNLKQKRLAATANRGQPSAEDFVIDATFIDVAVAKDIGLHRHTQLLQKLLEQSAWGVAHTLLHELQLATGFNPLAHRDIGSSFMKLVDALLQPAHDVLFPKGPFGPCLLPPLDPDGATTPRSSLPAAQPLNTEMLEVLHWLGAYGFRSPKTLTCLLRVLRHIMLTHPPASPAFVAAERVLRTTAFPSTLLVQGNQALSMAAWECIGALPFEARFGIYNHARRLQALSDQASADPRPEAVPLLRAQRTLVDDEIGRLTRRMSMPSDLEERKLVLRTNSRMVFKLAAGSPFVVAERLCFQALNYSNQHETLVEIVRLMPPLQLDVLLHHILNHLTTSTSPRINPSDNTNLSEWLTFLSAFLTALIVRHGHSLDVSAVCQYIYLRLRSGDAYDVILLHDLMTHLLGLHTVSELSREQLAALPGSDMLKAVSLMTPLSFTPEHLRRESKRLLGAMNADADPRKHLALPIFITLCQQRPILCSSFASHNVKLISELYDRTQTTLLQYLRFLHALPEPDFRKLLLPLETLLGGLEMDKETVMTFYRPILRKALEGWDGSFLKPTPEQPDSNGGANGTSAAPDPLSLQGLVNTVHKIISKDFGVSQNTFNPVFYLLFWALELHDLQYPEASYKEHQDSLVRKKRELEGRISSMTRELAEQKRRKDNQMGYGGGYGGYGNKTTDPVTVNAHEIAALEDELRQISHAADVLPVQQQQHEAHVKRMHALFAQGKDSFFRTEDPDKLESLTMKDGTILSKDLELHQMKSHASLLLQECILPRCLNSHEDALYCAVVLQHLLTLKTSCFNYVSVLESVFKEVICLMKCITDREAELLVVFVRQLVAGIEPLNDEAVFNRDIASTDAVRFVSETKKGARQRGRPSLNAEAEAGLPQFVDFAGWTKLSNKWQDRVCQNLANMMGSNLDTSVRNALKMSQDLVPYIPTVRSAFRFLDNAINQLLAKVQSDNTKQDIKQLALAAQRQLENCRKTCNAELPGAPKVEGTPEPGSADRNVDESAPPQARGRGELRADAKEFMPRGIRFKDTGLEAGELEAGEVAEETTTTGVRGRGSRRGGGGDDGDGGPGSRKRRNDGMEPGEQPGRQRPRQDNGPGARARTPPPRRERYDDGRAPVPPRRGMGGMHSDRADYR